MIPKIIHYFWCGEKNVPPELQRCIDSWKRVMPDYEIKLWNEDNYDITKCPYMKEAYDAKKWGFVPDYARLDIILTWGGIYLDTDVEAVRPFDDLLTLRGFCGINAGYDNVPESVNFGLGFGAEKGHEMIRILRDDYDSLHFRKPDGSLDLTPSPLINTKVLFAHGFKLKNERQEVNGLTVLPAEYFSAMNQYTGITNITPETHSIHHYSATWMSPADQERRQLRKKYSFLGKAGSNIASTFIAYRKHYGLVKMWWKILTRSIEHVRDGKLKDV